MFLHLLNQSQQENFVGLAYELIGVDGVRDVNETVQIQAFAKQIYGSDKPELDSYQRPSDLNAIFSDKRSKRTCLIELTGMCYIDGTYCDQEKEFIQTLSDELKITTEELDEINIWVKELVKKTIEGTELITKN